MQRKPAGQEFGNRAFVWWIALLVLITGTGCIDPGPPEPPYLNKFLVSRSPAGTHEATFYNFGPGGSGFLNGTVSRPLFVNVRSSKEPFDPKTGQVLAIRHGYNTHLVWTDETHLTVEYPDSADVEKKVAESGGVSVTFLPKHLPGGMSAEDRSEPREKKGPARR